MFTSRFLAQAAVSLVLVLRANAESHVIKFVNQCGVGSPALMYNGKNILTGDTYTSNGPYSGIAYLQTGYCNVNGENCTLLETTLINPACAGCGSSTDISLIAPHQYSVKTSFAYYNGCDGQGHTCSNSSCTDAAFFAPNDNFVQVACQVNNVNLLIAFCADAAQLLGGTTSTPSTKPNSVATTPSASASPTPTPSCRPRPTGLPPSNPGPASSPKVSTTPSSPPSPPSDPCDDGSTPTPTPSASTPQRRYHRRTNRIHY